MIGLGKESKGLYLLQHAPSHTALATNASSSSTSTLWHTRLGHPSFSKLALLNKIVASDVANRSDCCDVCQFSKQKRLPFSISTHVSHKPFELMHSDLWGPFSTCTVEGFKYF